MRTTWRGSRVRGRADTPKYLLHDLVPYIGEKRLKRTLEHAVEVILLAAPYFEETN